MFVSVIFQALAAVMTITLLLEVRSAIGGASRLAGEPSQSRVEPTRTGKERLGGKWSDEQRIDNCNVPPDRRGPKPRPDRCIEDSGMDDTGTSSGR